MLNWPLLSASPVLFSADQFTAGLAETGGTLAVVVEDGVVELEGGVDEVDESMRIKFFEAEVAEVELACGLLLLFWWSPQLASAKHVSTTSKQPEIFFIVLFTLIVLYESSFFVHYSVFLWVGGKII